jgi:DNA-binding transcriptional ArsR family regulator
VRKNKGVSESLVLRDLAQIKALADPLRQRLLRAFAGTPQTTKQIAHSLGEKPTKLYHHVDTLADAGLLKLVETRPKRGTTERYYQAAAKQFSVHRNIFRHLSAKIPDSEKIAPDTLFENAFTRALSDIRDNISDATPHARSALMQARICATPAEAAAMRKKIQRLLENRGRGKRTRQGKKGLDQFEVLLAIYPARSQRRR